MVQYKKHFENLDASRFFAFLLVFIGHAIISVTPEMQADYLFLYLRKLNYLGAIGLGYLFVLSSFLISWIIQEEKRHTADFNLKNFLFRRTLRIWPLYFLVVLLGFAIQQYALHTGNSIQPLPPFHYFGLFILNFYIIDHGTGFLFFLTFLWTISVEEQFYLLWSLAVKYTRIHIVPLAFILIIVSVVFRYIYANDGQQLFFSTFSILGDFGTGALASYLAFTRKPLFLFIQQGNRYVSVAVYVLLFLGIFYFREIDSFIPARIFSRLFFALLFAYIILEQAFSAKRLFRMGKWKVFEYLGKISYGLYCFHGVVITVMLFLLPKFVRTENYLAVFVLYPAIILFFSILISAAGYSIYRRTFGKLKQKYSY